MLPETILFKDKEGRITSIIDDKDNLFSVTENIVVDEDGDISKVVIIQ